MKRKVIAINKFKVITIGVNIPIMVITFCTFDFKISLYSFY